MEDLGIELSDLEDLKDRFKDVFTAEEDGEMDESDLLCRTVTVDMDLRPRGHVVIGNCQRQAYIEYNDSFWFRHLCSAYIPLLYIFGVRQGRTSYTALLRGLFFCVGEKGDIGTLVRTEYLTFMTKMIGFFAIFEHLYQVWLKESEFFGEGTVLDKVTRVFVRLVENLNPYLTSAAIGMTMITARVSDDNSRRITVWVLNVFVRACVLLFNTKYITKIQVPRIVVVDTTTINRTVTEPPVAAVATPENKSAVKKRLSAAMGTSIRRAVSLQQSYIRKRDNVIRFILKWSTQISLGMAISYCLTMFILMIVNGPRAATIVSSNKITKDSLLDALIIVLVDILQYSFAFVGVARRFGFRSIDAYTASLEAIEIQPVLPIQQKMPEISKNNEDDDEKEEDKAEKEEDKPEKEGDKPGKEEDTAEKEEDKPEKEGDKAEEEEVKEKVKLKEAALAPASLSPTVTVGEEDDAVLTYAVC